MDMVFTYLLQPGDGITIWQSANSFDSMHEMRRGGACPGGTLLQAVNDPDTTRMSWTNTLSTPEPVYYLLTGTHPTSEGAFTLEWEVHREGGNLKKHPLRDNWFRKREMARKRAFPQRTAWFRKQAKRNAAKQSNAF